jgi:hypothetical protein
MMLVMTRLTASLSTYETRHLVEHLHAVGNGPAIHRLLRLEDTPEAANAWFAAQERIGNVDGYLRDLQFALELTGPGAFGLEARYALMTSSARSVASMMPAALLGASVEIGVRTVSDVLAQLQRITDPAVVADGLISLAPRVPAERQADLRVLAAGLADDRGRAFAGLAGSLAQSELPALLTDLERLAPEMADHDVAATVTALAERLGELHAPRLLILARGIKPGVLRARVLVTLADENDLLLEEALDDVRSDIGHFERSDLFARLIAALPRERRGSLVREAIADLKYAENTSHLARQLHLQGDELMMALRRAMELHPWEKGPEALLRLAPEVPDTQLGELLELTRAGTGPGARATAGTGLIGWHDRTVARMVADIAGRLPDRLRDTALGIVAELDRSPDRCIALAALGEPERAAAEAAELPDPDARATALFALGDAALDAAMRAVSEIGRPETRAQVLLASGREELQPQALAAARVVDELWRRVELLLRAIVAADDREPIVREALGLIAERGTERFNPRPGDQLAELGPFLPASLAREAAATALLFDPRDVPQAAAALAPHLTEDGLRVLVDDCGRLPVGVRAKLLSQLAGSVPPALHASVLTQVAQLDGKDILPVVDAYAERLTPPLIEEALRICRRIGDAAAAVSAAADLVAAAGLRPVPEFVFDGMLATGDLGLLAPLMSDGQLARALAATKAMARKSLKRAGVLGALALVMPQERLGELVERAGRDGRALAGVVQSGASRFAPPLVDAVADRAAALADDVDRFTSVAALAPRLTRQARDRLRKGTEDVDLLLALVPGADPAMREELLDAAATATRQLDTDAATSAAYLEISRLLDGKKRTEVLEAALSWAYVVEIAEAREPILEEVLSELATVDPRRAILLARVDLPECAWRRLLPHLISRLDAAEQLEAAQQAEAASEDERADLLAELLRVKGLAATTSAWLRDAVQRLTEPRARVKALAAMAGEAYPELRALAETRDLPDPSRQLAFRSLLALGPDDARAAVFASLLATRRSSPPSAPLDVGVVFDGAAEPALLWAKLMRVLAGHPRPTVLDALAAFADVVAGHGEEVTAQIVDAIKESILWWP